MAGKYTDAQKKASLKYQAEKKRMTILFDHEDYDKLLSLSTEKGISIAQSVREAVKDYIEK